MSVRPTDPKVHWDTVWAATAPHDTSWTQRVPVQSLQLIARYASPEASIVDVGGGASTLVDHLLDAGYGDLTVLDVADGAIAHARARLATRAIAVSWIVADVTRWQPERSWQIWHDRAAFHFLTEDAQLDRYVATAEAAVAPGGHLIVSTFGPEGPTSCSGLPVRRWDHRGLAARFGESFRAVDATTSVHTTPRGISQQFVTATLVRVAPARGS